MTDYGMSEPEFMQLLERHLTALANAFARRFGVSERFRIKVERASD